MARALAACVVAMAVILAGLAAWLVAGELPDFWDPCHEWGAGGSGNLTIYPGDECPNRTYSSQTRSERAAVLASINGGTVVASVLAIVGTWRRRAWPLAVAAALMLGVSVLLFLGFSVAYPLTLAAAILDFVAFWRGRRRSLAAATVSEGS